MNRSQGTVSVNRSRTDDDPLVHLLLAAQASGTICLASAHPFAQFVARTERALARFVQGKVRQDRHRVDDLVQETYLRVWKGLPDFDPNKLGPGGVQAWLCRIARNAAVSSARRKRPSVGLDGLAASSDDGRGGLAHPASPEADPVTRAHANHVNLRLQQAVAELRSDKQAILKMHYLDDLSHKEIAARLGLTLGQVNMKLYAARQELRMKLEAVVAEGA